MRKGKDPELEPDLYLRIPEAQKHEDPYLIQDP